MYYNTSTKHTKYLQRQERRILIPLLEKNAGYSKFLPLSTTSPTFQKRKEKPLLKVIHPLLNHGHNSSDAH